MRNLFLGLSIILVLVTVVMWVDSWDYIKEQSGVYKEAYRIGIIETRERICREWKDKFSESVRKEHAFFECEATVQDWLDEVLTDRD